MGKYDRWDQFFAELEGDEVRFDLDDLEDVTGVQLPPSARRWQPWWGGTPYYAHWRRHGWYAHTRLDENAVVFSREPGRPGRPRGRSSPREPAPAARRQQHPTKSDADAILVGCVAQKRTTASPAKDLYISPLWRGRRSYAESTGKPWFILSAEHGLVQPDDMIEPYDRHLESESAGYRTEWSREAARQVADAAEGLGVRSVEIHAGSAYIDSGLQQLLEQQGLKVLRPLQGKRIGEQLSWYGSGTKRIPTTAGTPSSGDVAPRGRAAPVGAHVQAIAATYRSGALGESWEQLPEVWHYPKADPTRQRLWVTFVAAVDRARDAARLWAAAHRAWDEASWLFNPSDIVTRSLTDLSEALRHFGLSQRHSIDSGGWRTIAETLASADCPDPIRAAIEGRPVAAAAVLAALAAKRPSGTPMFPLLSGPKIGPMWVRMLAFPGGSPITGINVIPVAVDTHVQRVTEMLGLVPVRELDDRHRRHIQDVWFAATAEAGLFDAPAQLDGTAAGLDPAIWALGKEGCSVCERARAKQPVGPVCDLCVLGRIKEV